MAIALFNPISKNFYSKLINCNDFNDLIDICVENVNEFSSAIKRIHGSQPCKLETCQVRFVCEGLGKYLKDNLRRISLLLRKELILISEKYPGYFRDCVFLLKKECLDVAS